MVKIKINNMKIFGFHGVYEEEIKSGQEFILNLEYESSKNSNNFLNDNIKDAIDYIDVIQKIELYFNIKRFNLIENLAKYLISRLKDDFQLDYIKITIKKDFINLKQKINADSIEVEETFINE